MDNLGALIPQLGALIPLPSGSTTEASQSAKPPAGAAATQPEQPNLFKTVASSVAGLFDQALEAQKAQTEAQTKIHNEQVYGDPYVKQVDAALAQNAAARQPTLPNFNGINFGLSPKDNPAPVFNAKPYSDRTDATLDEGNQLAMSRLLSNAALDYNSAQRILSQGQNRPGYKVGDIGIATTMANNALNLLGSVAGVMTNRHTADSSNQANVVKANADNAASTYNQRTASRALLAQQQIQSAYDAAAKHDAAKMAVQAKLAEGQSKVMSGEAGKNQGESLINQLRAQLATQLIQAGKLDEGAAVLANQPFQYSTAFNPNATEANKQAYAIINGQGLYPLVKAPE